MKIKHYVWSSIHINWKGQPLDKDWVDKRFHLYTKYFLPCLEKQTEKDFEILLYINPSFPYCVEKFSELKDRVTISLVDGNFSQGFASDENIVKSCEGYDWVYHTRCDTDDLFAPKTIELIRDFKPREEHVIRLGHSGFNYHLICKKMGIWGNEWAPNSTFVYPTDMFIDKQRSTERGLLKHGLVKKMKNIDWTDNYQYCVLVHYQNTSTGFQQGNPRKMHIDWFKERFPQLHAMKGQEGY